MKYWTVSVNRGQSCKRKFKTNCQLKAEVTKHRSPPGVKQVTFREGEGLDGAVTPRGDTPTGPIAEQAQGCQISQVFRTS